MYKQMNECSPFHSHRKHRGKQKRIKSELRDVEHFIEKIQPPPPSSPNKNVINSSIVNKKRLEDQVIRTKQEAVKLERLLKEKYDEEEGGGLC